MAPGIKVLAYSVRVLMFGRITWESCVQRLKLKTLRQRGAGVKANSGAL